MSFIKDAREFLRSVTTDAEVRPAAGSGDLSTAATSLAARRMAMYIAVGYVASAMSTCEVKTYEGGEPVKGDLYYALNYDPNPNQNASAFMVSLVERYFYDGAALMVQPVTHRNHFYIADGFGIEDRPLEPDGFTSVVVDGKTLARPISAADACYFKLEDKRVAKVVSDMYADLGEMLACAMDSYRLANGEKFILRKAHAPGGRRPEEQKTTDEVNDRLRPFIEGRNGVLPLHDGQDLVRLAPNGSGSSKDVIDIRRDIFDTTAAAFKIPQSMMYGNMTNSEDVVNQFITFGVDPIAVMIGKEMTRKFYGPRWSGGANRISIDTSKISHYDMFQVADRVEKLISTGTFSIDEIRDPLGADPLGTDFSQAHWVTKNYSLIQDALAQLMSNPSAGGGEKE